ncbi:MAG: hypothetical protein KDK45_11810, partial [Leptospiraceae bacterium]|nr:hypothetical protein [Leptospiraceae bacterium]
FLIHDESSNNDLDLTIPDKEYLYLIPKWPTEGFGFSSYNRPVLITPKFKDAMFEFNEPEQKVDLNVFYLYARYGFLFVAIPLIISSM